MITMGWWWSN